VPATKSRHSGSDAYCAGRSSRQGAAGLRTSYDRRGLQAVKPSARGGGGELRAGTPPHFRAYPFRVNIDWEKSMG